MSLKVLFHVNHLWGVGHFARIATIANAVVETGGTATIISGNTPVAGRLNDAVRLVALPVLRAQDTSYARLVTAEGGPVTEDFWASRAAIMADALSEAAPDILVTETFPFGRRKLARELMPLIAAARARDVRIVASIRDLPTPPADRRRLEECADRLVQNYDAVLIHGDPAITPLDTIWPGEIPVPARLTGYVAAAPEPAPANARTGIIVSAGGGGDAAPLLRAAIAAACSGSLPVTSWDLIMGPSALPSLRDELVAARNQAMEGRSAAASVPIAIHGAVPDLPARIARSRLSISRGGYNTMVETLAAGTRSIVVPFAPPGEPEQRLRAEAFAARGLARHLDESDLASLPHAGAAALAGPAPPADAVLMNGAAASAAWLAEIAGRS